VLLSTSRQLDVDVDE
jgi:hypothetical protein